MGTKCNESPFVHFQYLIFGKGLDPSILSLFALPITVNVFTRQEDSSRKIIPFENRIDIDEMILISIVKGNSESFSIEFLPMNDMINYLIQTDNSVLTSKQIIHMRPKNFNWSIYSRR